MSTRNFSRRATIQGYANSRNAPCYVDSDDNILKMIPAGSGTTEVQIVDSTSTQTITGDKTFTGTVVMSGAVTKTEFADGAVGAPSITFSSDLTTGAYRIGTSNIGVTAGGAKVLDVSATGLGVTGTTLSGDGTVSLPGIGFSGDTDCGIYRIGTNNLGVAVAGAKVLDVSATGLGVTGTVSPSLGVDFNGLTPAASPISLTGVTLAANTNAIRGVSIAPTRVSGWTCFTGTTTMSAYMDYREMHTADGSLIYGSGFFPFMDSGASCASMSAIQAICQADAGATVTTAASAQGTGIYPIWAKALINTATVDSGAQIAAAWLSVQANVTDISGQASAIIHGEVASGLLRDILYLNATGGVLSTYFLNVSASTSPFLSWGADNQPNAATADLGIRCKIGSSEYWIPLYVNT